MKDSDETYGGPERRRGETSQEELERRVFHLKTLHDVSQGLPVLRGTEAIVKNLLLMVMGVFGATSGLVFFLDPKNSRLETLLGRGLSESAVKALTEAFGEDAGRLEIPAGAAAASGTDELFAALGRAGTLLAGLGLDVWTPFRIDGKLHGGIGLGCKLSGERYSAADRELLVTLAAQGAAAVANARLLERMKEEEIIRFNLSRYLSPHMVEQVISNTFQVNLGGARREVTVLFSDIRNFTSLAETLPPERLVQFLNKYFTAMAACVFESQGSIDKFIGDAVMAVFGSLIPVENGALSAVESALQMMRILPQVNEQWAQTLPGFSASIGIGITTGEVFLGNIGSPEKMEYTVIGDPVNVASRFSGIATAGQIIVDRPTLERLGGAFPYREHPPTHVRGKSEKVEVFEILCPC
jgi:class 3 adenylate cyclase